MGKFQLSFAGLCCVLGVVVGEVAFSVSDCAKNRATELFNIPTVSISPHPVRVPGDITISGNLLLNRAASGSMSLQVKIQRYLGFFWLTVPCVSNVGSCTYADACALVNGISDGAAACPQQLVDNNVPCSCPFSAGAYSMNSAVFTIPELSGIWSWLAAGDYRVTAHLIDNASGEELACQHMELTIEDGHASSCSGLGCIFG